MGKRIPVDAKIVAYNDAICALLELETDHDTPDEISARGWLADKLDRECDRMIRRDRRRFRAAENEQLTKEKP